MCGIFGVRGHSDAVALTKLGLFSLQHRGQESAGIVSVDAGTARGVRSMGLVSDMPLAPLADLSQRQTSPSIRSAPYPGPRSRSGL